jgi:hypothetical protein
MQIKSISDSLSLCRRSFDVDEKLRRHLYVLVQIGERRAERQKSDGGVTVSSFLPFSPDTSDTFPSETSL